MQFQVPTAVMLPSKSKPKRIILNLNWFRNANFHVINAAKRSFYEMLDAAYPDVGKSTLKYPIKLGYHYYHNTAAAVDTNNPLVVIDKFFQDWLVTRGIIPDDNKDFVDLTIFSFKGVIRDANSTCFVTLYDRATNVQIKEAVDEDKT